MHCKLPALRLGLLLAVLVVERGWAAERSDEATDFYSRGVRAYFSGDSAEAELYLSLAMEHRPDDPRLYYFRALAFQRQGRINEARGDIVVGAALEAAHPQRYAVGRVLERVQGGRRLQFEQVRREVRRDAATQPPVVVQARHETVAFNDEPFLRRPVTVSLDEFLPVSGLQLEPEEPYPLEPPPRLPESRAAESRSQTPTGERSPEATSDPFVDDPIGATESEAAAGAGPTAARSPAADEADFLTDEEDPFENL